MPGDTYDYVICGHIHKPEMKEVVTEKGSIVYLNSGDWIENLTALEYADQKWSIYKHDDALFANDEDAAIEDEPDSNKKLFDDLVMEFNLLNRSV